MSECFGKLNCWAAGLLVCLSACLLSSPLSSADLQTLQPVSERRSPLSHARPHSSPLMRKLEKLLKYNNTAMKHKTYIDTTDMYQTDIRQDKFQIGQLGDSHVSNKSHIKAHGQRQIHENIDICRAFSPF